MRKSQWSVIDIFKCDKFFKIKGEILIHNCDTSYKLEYENIKNIFDKNFFGIIPYFNSEGQNWSFIKIKNDLITKVKEKERISTTAP